MWLAEHDAPQDQVEIRLDYMHFHHIVSWWPHRKDPNMLLVFFEDLKKSYESSVRSIAQFMGICDEASIQAALEKSTFEYMKQHSDKFNLKLFKNCDSSTTFRFPQTTRIKIRTGTTNVGPTMRSAQLCAEIQKKWEEIVTPVTTCSTYQELRSTCSNQKSSTSISANGSKIIFWFLYIPLLLFVCKYDSKTCTCNAQHAKNPTTVQFYNNTTTQLKSIIGY